MITAIFGGPTSDATEITRRRNQMLNLLEVAAPNEAVERDRKAYADLLEAVITGRE